MNFLVGLCVFYYVVCAFACLYWATCQWAGRHQKEQKRAAKMILLTPVWPIPIAVILAKMVVKAVPAILRECKQIIKTAFSK